MPYLSVTLAVSGRDAEEEPAARPKVPASSVQPPSAQCWKARSGSRIPTFTVSPGSASTAAKPASHLAGRSTAESGRDA